MMTLQQFSAKLENLPASTAWYLADLSEARGKQELFTRQTPQRLKEVMYLKGVKKRVLRFSECY